MRTKNLTEAIKDTINETEEIMSTFEGFTDGTRMLMLLYRKKDGGSNKEEQRVFESHVTSNRDEFKSKLMNLLWLKKLYPNCRIYSCVNSRNQKKIIREIHNHLIEQYYSDEECANSIQKKIIKNPRSFVMKPSTRKSSFFLLDIDDEDGADKFGEALTFIAENEIEEIQRYRTKNGWHVVTKPFNPSNWDTSIGEIKKDALLLLSY